MAQRLWFRGTAFGVFALVGLLVACDAGSPSLTNHVKIVEEGDEHLFAHTWRSSASASAAIAGTLAVNEDQCLGVSANDTFTIVIFPYRTRWLSPTSVRISGKAATVGDQVQFGGGMTDTEETLAMVSEPCPSASAQVFDAG